jgi:CheY-like chemotaxis protein
VLIAEDEETNYLYIETLLERYNPGLKILHARNGQEAVEICHDNKEIDLVLMDIKMPLLNGNEATKKIKSFRPHLPVIAQTAYSTTDDINLSKSAGCDDFISKPIGAKILYSIIASYLKK